MEFVPGQNGRVMTEYSGAGDPRRSLELLWGVQERPRRGPKPKLTVERIVEAAMLIADSEGLAALSMRRVADELDVSAMSLYTYVPSKAELIDLMLDRAHGQARRPEHVEGGWRARLEQIARESWGLFHRHPWMLQVATSRPPMGPSLLDKYEYELGAVEGIGLTDLEMDETIATLTGFVQGAARVAVEAAQIEQRTGMSDAQWWEATAPVLGELIDTSRYPLGSRVGTAAGTEYGSASAPERAFEFGLQRLLDGVEALVSTRAGRHPGAG